MNVLKQNAIDALVKQNLLDLSENPYPGRVIYVGKSSDGEFAIMAYALTGRSENSRNRILTYDEATDRVSTEAADPAKVQDPSLIIYTAMEGDANLHVVSNGHQTDGGGGSEFGLLWHAISSFEFCKYWIYEPDVPNFTPRIMAKVDIASEKVVVEMGVFRKSPFGDECDRCIYQYDDMPAGYGRMISTYTGDGNPLPSFTGEPKLMQLEGSIEDVTKTLWNALNEENRISLVVKFINLEALTATVLLKNKYEKVVA